MDTRTHTPVRPSWAERARTVLAAAASASVLWDGGRVDLLGCHHDDAQGDVILTLESTSMLVRAARAAPGGDLAVEVHLTELCAVSANQRVLSQVRLAGSLVLSGPLSGPPHAVVPHAAVPHAVPHAVPQAAVPHAVPHAAVPHRAGPPVTARVRVGDVTVTVTGPASEASAEEAARVRVPVEEYRTGEPDPLHPGAAAQLQHLSAHHAAAIDLLSRLCGREVLAGAVRVLPIALDRYGIVLRVERLRGHHDVRIPFDHRVDTGAQAATQIGGLLARGARRRPCGR